MNTLAEILQEKQKEQLLAIGRGEMTQSEERAMYEEMVVAILKATLGFGGERREGSPEARAMAFELCGAIMAAAGERELGAALARGGLHLDVGEPFFTLRGKDRLAAGVIFEWIRAAEVSGVPEPKIEAARDAWELFSRYAGPRSYPA